MQNSTEYPTHLSESAAGLAAVALRASAWAGEPFLHEGENPDESLAPGTARRRALDEAVLELDAGHRQPSPQWKTRFALMLGLCVTSGTTIALLMSDKADSDTAAASVVFRNSPRKISAHAHWQ